jgi:hypothetical protein
MPPNGVTTARLGRPRPVMLALATCLAALVLAAPAGAVWNPAGSVKGYIGPWLGSYGLMACAQHTGLVTHAGPWVGRTSAYPRSAQTISMRSRLERLSGGRYVITQFGGWHSVATSPGQYAKFAREYFRVTGDGVVRIPPAPDGVYRVSYEFRWYVAGRLVGSVLTYHHDSEIVIDRMEHQWIVSNGCTMDV